MELGEEVALSPIAGQVELEDEVAQRAELTLTALQSCSRPLRGVCDGDRGGRWGAGGEGSTSERRARCAIAKREIKKKKKLRGKWAHL